MKNGIIINGTEYRMHKTSDVTVEPCKLCDLRKRCGKNTLYGPCSLVFWSDNLRFTYFKKVPVTQPDTGRTDAGMEIKDILHRAVELISGGKITPTQPRLVTEGVVIRRSSKSGLTKWNLFEKKEGKDYLYHEDANGIISMRVGKPGTHWLDCEHYLIYRP